MLFRLICHRKGIILSVAIYMNVSVYFIIRTIFHAQFLSRSYLNRIQHFDNPWMSQGSEFLDRVSCEWQGRLICVYIEGEHTASRPIVLLSCQHPVLSLTFLIFFPASGHSAASKSPLRCPDDLQ